MGRRGLRDGRERGLLSRACLQRENKYVFINDFEDLVVAVRGLAAFSLGFREFSIV